MEVDTAKDAKHDENMTDTDSWIYFDTNMDKEDINQPELVKKRSIKFGRKIMAKKSHTFVLNVEQIIMPKIHQKTVTFCSLKLLGVLEAEKGKRQDETIETPEKKNNYLILYISETFALIIVKNYLWIFRQIIFEDSSLNFLDT